MATRYEQGRDTEYAACRLLTAIGFEPRRAGASKGKWDVHGVSSKVARYVQCKRFTTKAMSYSIDVAELDALVLPPYATAELWIKKHGVKGWVERLLVKHTLPGEEITVESIDMMGDIVHPPGVELGIEKWTNRSQTGSPRATRRTRTSPSTHPSA